MREFYNVVSRLALIGLLLISGHLLRAQCAIGGLQPTYCTDDAAILFTGGENVFGPGINGSNFAPTSAGPGTHKIYSSSYSVSNSGVFNPDLTVGTAVSFAGDGNSPPIPLFNFVFFGATYSSIVVNENGYVTFGAYPGSGTAQALPDPIAPNNLIAGAWDDLDVSLGGSITTVTVGSSPSRRFLITFTNVPYASGPATVTFQIQLHESTNVIEIHSTDIQDDGASGATQGIENPAGTGGYFVPGRNLTAWTATSDYQSFTPTCTEVHTVIVTAPPSNSLTVTAPPQICPGTGAPVTIANAESGVLYQLQDDTAPTTLLSSFYAGSGGNLTIISSNLAASTSIRVYARNSSTGCDTNLGTVVTVDPSVMPPTISSQPGSATVCQGAAATFTVDATPTTTPGYQWQVSINDGATFVNLSDDITYNGVNTASLAVSNIPAVFNGRIYRVLVSGVCSPPAVSNWATLTVDQIAAITTQPSASPACEGSTVQLNVVATGAGLTYQWYESPSTALANGAVYGGVDTPVLTIANVPAAYNGKTYFVKVTGTCTASFDSDPVTLTINEKPEILTQPASKVICQNANTSFVVDAGVTSGVTFQWQLSSDGGVTYANVVDDAIYGGANASTLNLNTVPLSYGSNRYRVLVGGSCSPSVTSNAAVLTVNETTAITAQPVGKTVCEDGTTQLSVTTTGTGIIYQWYESPSTALSNSGNYSGVGTNALTLMNVPSAFNGKSYYVKITGSCTAAFNSSTVAVTVDEKPEITGQPGSSTICENGTATFTVNAGVTTSATYQWQVSTDGGVTYSNVADDAIYNGSATASLAVSTTPLSYNSNRYRIVVTGSCSPSVTSNAAVLTVNESVAITVQPVAKTVCEDGTTQLSVTTTGTGITYQWYESPSTALSTGPNYSGVGTSSLTLINVPTAFNGKSYYVKITGSCTAAFNSSTVAVTVDEKPEITGQPGSSTICENGTATFTVNAGVTTSATYQWQVSTDGGVTYSNVADDAIYNGSATASLAVSTTPLSYNSNRYRIVVTGSCSPSVTSNAAVLTVNESVAITVQPVAKTVCEDGTTQLSVTTTGTGITYQWYESPSTALSTGPNYSGVGTSSLTLINVPTAFNGKSYYVKITGSCTAAFNSSTVAVTVDEKPEITGQPGSSTICENGTATFTVNAGVTTSATYQWQVSTDGGVTYSNVADDAIYNGSATASLAVSTTPLSYNSNRYRIVVTGSCSPSVTSNAAVLTVNESVAITVQPVAKTVCEDGTTQLSVTTTGTGITYQWYESPSTALSNSGNYSGVGTSSLTLINVPTAFNGKSYYVKITGSCTAAFNSSTVAVTVDEKPEITGQPGSSTICENGTATFTVNAGVTTSATYQWQVSTDGGVTYSNVADDAIYNGSATASLAVSTTPLSYNSNRYRIVVTGSCSPSVTSNAAVLTVNESVAITVQPVAKTVCEDGTTQLSVTTTGTGITYQWYESPSTALSTGPNYSGVGTSSLTLINVPTAFNGKSYYVKITGSCTAAFNSSTVAVTVDEKPEITGQPGSSTICENGTATFTVNAGVTTSATYQWQVSTDGGVTYSNVADDAIYNGSATASLAVSTTPLSYNSNRYRIVVTGSCSPSVTSNAAVLTVNESVAITVQPVAKTVCEDGTTQLSVTTTGTGIIYQWYESPSTALSNSGNYSGVGTNALTLMNVPSAFNGKSYYVKITGSCTAAFNSSTVAVTVDEKPEITGQPGSSTICENGTATFTVNAGVTTSATYQWQVSTDGGVTYSNVADDAIYNGSATASLAVSTTPLSYNSNRYRIVVTGSCSPSVTSNAAVLTVNESVAITVQPVAKTVCEDGTTQLSVTTTGTGITYQWYESPSTALSTGPNYSGVGTSSLTLINVPTAFNGKSYYVKITGSCTAAFNSSTVAVTVDEKPEITGQPGSSTICENGTATFTVNAGVTTSATYQWQVSTDGGVTYSNVADDAIYNGSATASLAVSTTPLSYNSNRYRIVVTGSCSPSVTSNAAVLTVNESVAITVQPVAKTVCEDGTTQLSVTTTGTGVTYQWYESPSTALSNSGNYSGVGTNALTLMNVPSAFNGKSYYVKITGSCTAAFNSSTVAVTVDEKPEITGQPVSSMTCENSNTSFTVNAGVTTGVLYQWQVSADAGVTYSNVSNGGVYAGATTSTLTLNTVPLAYNSQLYRALVSGGCTPSVASNGAILTVYQNPVIMTAPVLQSICEGSGTTFSVAAVGQGLTYQWKENGVNISNGGAYAGATTATLTLSNVPVALNAKTYEVEITGTCGIISSTPVSLTVRRVPDAFAADAAICSGQTTNIAITNPNSVPTTSFSWTIQSVSNVTGASPGSGATIAQALSSSDGFSSGSVTYLIQPVAAGCSGTPYAVSVTVKPLPDAAASPETICSGTTTHVVISNPNGVTGTTYTWSILSSTNVSGALAGSGSVIGQTLAATDGINSGTVTYRITPSAGSCNGAAVDVVVTVDPTPVITNTPSTLIAEICSNTALGFTPTASITGTTFAWTSTVIGTLTGVSATGNGAVNDTPVNGTNTNAVIIYRITPSVGTCGGTPVNYVVTVRPVTSASASPATICSGSSTSVAISNPNGVAGTTYTWTASASNVTGASAGSGNTITQVLSSSDGVSNGTVNYTITPAAYGCTGPTFPVTVTVKPVPVLTNSSASLSQTICSGEVLSFVPAASIASTTFSWTATASGPINPASITSSGSGNIGDTPVNTGNVSGIVTYRIVPDYNGCAGASVDYVVTVKPLPSVSASPVIICSGQTTVINLLSTPKSIPGTTYAWTVSTSPNVVGAASGDGSTIRQVLTSNNASIGTATYLITPMANGCFGPAISVVVTVNPIAIVNAGADYAVCQPTSIPLSGSVSGSATSGTWTIVSGAGTVSTSTTSSGTVVATYTVNASDIGNTVTFALSTNDPDGAGPCSVLTDNLVVAVNKAATVVVPANYVVCEPGFINLSGTIGGSATTGLWSLVTGGGTLSASSVTGVTATASYQPSSTDVGTTLRFRLTSNDPDGSGPCSSTFDEIDIKVNQAAVIDAGADFAVCEDQSISLAATASGATSSVLWTGGSGAAQFSPVNNVNSVYTLTPADITAGGVTLKITTNDPDAAGPCTTTFDQVFVRINKLPAVFLAGLESVYAENSGVDVLDGFPGGGSFTGPGIIAGTNQFNPANAGFGPITIRYTYSDPATTCTNFTERTTVVNPVTDVDFFILEDNRPNVQGYPQICANQGELTLVGIPPASAGYDPTKFRALSPDLVPRISYNGTDWKLNSDGLLAGTYQLQYIFTNVYHATDTLTKELIVFSAPQAIITMGNNCIEDIITFTEASVIPNNLSAGTIINWNWLYDEGSNGSTGTTAEPQYKYLDPGSKNISLEVVTNQACHNKATKTIVVGKPPVADFNWSSYCIGDSTRFVDTSSSEFGNISTYSWDFGDGGTHNIKNPKHKYQSFGTYPVKLSISTDAGCSADTIKQVYIQEMRVLSDDEPYHVNFENGQETWVAVSNPGDPKNSWEFGTPQGTAINSASSGTNAFWTGANGGSYFNNENSFVIGPCLNLTALKRPMISLNYWVDAQKGFDGAVVQYSTNGGVNWQTIGDAEGGGKNWYNSRNLPGEPGGQSNFAWSDGGDPTLVNTKWTNGRFNLDQIPVQVRDTVILRIAFGSNDDNLPGRALSGFAFDDIFVGEKTRNVLVEHFANVNSTASNQATIDLKKRYKDQFLTKDSSDFFAIEYHIPFGSKEDQINLDNPQDPVARALFYNVSQPPNTIMDGKQSEYFNGYTANINAVEIDRRALEDPRFSIAIDTVTTPGATNTSVRTNVTFTYTDTLNATLANRVTMNVALVERGVDDNGPVVRQLLLGPQGKTIDRSWAVGDNESLDIDYEIEVPIVNSDSLYLVAFIQDNIVGSTQSKEILQTKIAKLRSKVGKNITGVNDNPVTAELQDLSLYPNPASHILKITVPGILGREYSWHMIDQRGVAVLQGQLKSDFSDGPQEIDVSGLANGIYFMSIQTGSQSVVYKKVAIMNKN